MVFFDQNSASFCKIRHKTLFFKENRLIFFFAGNWRKSQKIVIVTSTPPWLKNDAKVLEKSGGKREPIGGNLCQSTPGLPDGIYFIPKIPIWVHFTGPWNGKVSLFCGHWNF
jgi:hypothetical protein